jgi:hypothetical protein
MSVFALLFEGFVAALMVALIVYCVRLDRRLAALRENDAGIRALIDELRGSAARAEAAVGRLKSAGLDAERSLAQAIRTAQAAHDDLMRQGRSAPVPSAARRPAVESARPPSPADPPVARPEIAPAADAQTFDSDRGPVAPRAASRSEAENALINAIRFARAEN